MVTRVAVQGKEWDLVEGYYLWYSQDGKQWKAYSESGDKLEANVRLFPVVSDTDNAHKCLLSCDENGQCRETKKKHSLPQFNWWLLLLYDAQQSFLTYSEGNQYAISELSFPSGAKRVFVWNHS